MYRVIAHVRSERGLHARPSAAVAKEAAKYDCLIKITNPLRGIVVNAKSVLEVMTLIAEQNNELFVDAEGFNSLAAANNVAKVINEFYIKEEEK